MGHDPKVQPVGAPIPSPLRLTSQERLRRESLARASEFGRDLGPITSRLVQTSFGTLGAVGQEAEDKRTDFLDPTGAGGGFALSFAQTAAGARLAASLARETDRISGRERLKLESTLFSLAKELLPPGDVETAMRQIRRGELVKSKLAFQAVLQNLSDAAQNEERRRDLDLAEENERRTLRQARSRITIDTLGKDVGLAILFALSGSGGE